MSISPTYVQRSNASSPALAPNPSSSHGFLLQPPSLHEETNLDISRSPQISPSDLPPETRISDAAVPTTADTATANTTGGSSKKVTDMRRPNGQKSNRRHFNGNHFQYQPAGRGRTSSQFRNDSDGYAQPVGDFARGVNSAENQPSSRTVGFHGSATHSPVRKNQTVNANHLLNFQYDRVSRPQPRIPPPRRPQKIRPYNKDLFLQANYRFVVLDSGNHSVESMNADKMLQWENVICVRYSTPYAVQCPICLDEPLCPQITSCGHIFCFPCILRYLLMGEEDHKGDCWKKCPLCFMMISLKDLYTIYIENVKHYRPGDVIQFTLLTRPKDSLILSQKNQDGVSTEYDDVDLCDNFARFSLTSDVELSVGEAYSELKDWLVRAESGLVDDLQLLPYVCAALEQLDQRKKFWSEMRSLTNSPPLGNSPSSLSNIKAGGYPSKLEPHLPSSSVSDEINSEETLSSSPTPCIGLTNKSNCLESKDPETIAGDERVTEIAELLDTFEGEKTSSSCEEGNIHPNGSMQMKEKDSYSFYQAVDGQNFILHPLNMKCLLHHYGSYDLLPQRISGKILQLETVTQTEAMRRRYRFLSHFSLTTTFQLCEIDMREILPYDALSPFMDEIKKREIQRKRLEKKEREEKSKAEASLMQSTPIFSTYGGSSSSSKEKPFTIDDFEALGSAPPSSSTPPMNDKKRFSDVTRLGFASAQDSPSLNVSRAETAIAGSSNLVALSFANVISTTKSPESPKMDVLGGKKGKKPTRVLLSTAGGRRY